MLARALESVRIQSVGQIQARVVLGLPRLEAYNVGLDAKTEFVTWLDDDDYWYPNHLAVLAEKADADVIYSKGQVGNKVIGKDLPLENLVDGDFIGNGYLYRTQVFRDIGGYPLEDGLTRPYGSLHWRAWKAGAKFQFADSPKPTMLVNIHGGNTVLQSGLFE